MNSPFTLKLGWYHSAGFLGFYVAQNLGYYTDEGLKVTIEQRRKTDQNNLDRVATGEYDFSVGAILLTLSRHAMNDVANSTKPVETGWWSLA